MDTFSLFKNSSDYKNFSPGETIFSAGSEPDALYVIEEGEVNIVAGDTILETLGTGEIFGKWL